MSIDADQLEEMLDTRTFSERVAERPRPIAIDCSTQYRGNRIVSRFYPEHYARVLLSRDARNRYGVVST